MWRVYNAAKKPFPELDGDEVVNYQIMEAVAIKVAQEDEAQRKEAERNADKKKWESNAQQELDAYR